MTQKKVSVLIPAFNEEKIIMDTIKSLLSLPHISEIVVVDDASQDKTAQVARAAGAKVHRLNTNLGKGEALNQGFPLTSGEVVLLLDADLGQTAREAVNLYRPVLQDQADLVVARFPRARQRGGFGLVKSLAQTGIKYYAGLETESPLSGQRALKRELLERLIPLEAGFGIEVGMTIKAALLGASIMEVPVNMHHRETGRDMAGFIHRGKQFWHVARALWSCRKLTDKQ